MKKNFFYSVMAVFTLLFMAACSQEEIISSNETNGGKVVLSVNVSGATPDTRAVADVQGYVMRCIMEAVDSEGTVIEGTRMVQPVTAGKATFEFEKNADAAQYLFWADYVAGDDYTSTSTTIYKADALTNITYRLNKTNDLFNNPAADAFCAAVATGDLSGSVTLKRPFTRINVKTADVEALGLTGLTRINPNLYAGAGFNVATGKATTKGQLQATADSYVPVLTDGEFAFYCYVLATVADETRTSTITFSNEDGTSTKSIQLTADQMMSLQSNTSVSLKRSEEPGDDKIKVEVVIDDAFEGEETDPEEPQPAGELKVGAYINAQGEVVAEATDAVAVVFSMAEGKADNSVYAEGKTAKAYAVSLNKAINRLRLGDCSTLSLATTDDASQAYAGYSFSNSIKTAFDAMEGDKSTLQIFNAFFTNNELTPVSASNLSEWYIPSIAQITDFMALEDATLKANVKAAYSGNYYCVSSSVVDGSVQGCLINVADGTVSKTETMSSTASGLIFSVLTIFE